MTTGTVKWFNPAKGFGFIEPEDGSQDAFVHISAVERAGLTTLNEGQKISYELQPGQNGKSSAENLKEVSDTDDAGDDASDDEAGESADTEDAGDDTDAESEEDAAVSQ
ncbi:MAG: cold-shock protein [Proteobacteria bacterium]|nr:cold-shock protein [Pseudomonadota bacterium]